LSQAISDGFQAKKPPNRTVLALLDFSKAYNKVWRADLLAMMLRKGVPVCFVRWIQGFLFNRQARVRLNRAYSRTWAMREGMPQGSVLAPLLFLFVIDDLQDRLPKGVHSSLFADDFSLRVHSPRKEDAVPVLQEGVREVYRWARVKKLTLNLKKCQVCFFSPDPHEAKWEPVVVVEGTRLAFNPKPRFLGVELGRTLSGKEQADSKAANLTKGSRMLMALSGSDWGWCSDLLRKVYQTSLLSGSTYAGGGWLPWLSATSMEMLDRTQNRNLRIITGQLASTPTDALRVETGFQSFGCLRDRAAAAALERLLRLDPATHPRAAQAKSGVTWRFKRGTDGRSLGKEVVGRVGGGLDALG
jgi:hypothetical protein